MREFNESAVRNAWARFEASVGVTAITTARGHARMVRLLNTLLDATGGDERHALAGLVDVVGDLIAAYEARELPVPDGKPAEVLRLLMEQNDLTQTDLREELGGQSVVSDVLAGRRRINGRQARALATRFGVPAGAFI
jgi:HTH-type transcriptional regulator/antitoxin HigA